MLIVRPDDLSSEATRALLALHLSGMHANSPPGHVFALDLSGLQQPSVTVWSAWEGNSIAGVGALKLLDGGIGEVAYYHWDVRLVGEPLLTALRIPHCAIQRIDEANTLIREAQLTVEGQKVPFAVLLPHHILWEEAV